MCERARLLLFVCIALIPLSAAFAQTTNDIEVQLEGCGDVRHASIILHGDDQSAMDLHRAGDLWKLHRLLSINTSLENPSLRLYPGRTTCRRALPDQTDQQGNVIARFVFRCVEGDYRRIEFSTGGDVSIAYRRHLDQSAVRGDVECDERGEFQYGHGTIADFDAHGEKIFIYPGFAKADIIGPGIMVRDPAKTAPVTKKYSRSELAALFVRQVGRGDGSAPPVISDNWRLRMQMGLKKLGVNNVSMAVRR
ncbi:MAG: hypothetical protein JWO97_4236 [Acidobacteria bacterium]|nr:hypothetical protein [Acidobacteriota bacterium]